MPRMWRRRGRSGRGSLLRRCISIRIRGSLGASRICCTCWHCFTGTRRICRMGGRWFMRRSPRLTWRASCSSAGCLGRRGVCPEFPGEGAAPRHRRDEDAADARFAEGGGGWRHPRLCASSSREWLGRASLPSPGHQFLHHVARHSGLLLPRGEGVYGFAHLSFQEYYAACHLQSDFARIVSAETSGARRFLRPCRCPRGVGERGADVRRVRRSPRLARAAPLPRRETQRRAPPSRPGTSLTGCSRNSGTIRWRARNGCPFPPPILATPRSTLRLRWKCRQRGAIWQALWKAQFGRLEQ